MTPDDINPAMRAHYAADHRGFGESEVTHCIAMWWMRRDDGESIETVRCPTCGVTLVEASRAALIARIEALPAAHTDPRVIAITSAMRRGMSTEEALFRAVEMYSADLARVTSVATRALETQPLGPVIVKVPT